MRALIGGLAVTAIIMSGCESRDAEDTDDTLRSSADTTVQERTVQDTTIVTHDTLVRSDTIVRRGGTTDTGTTGRDTVGRPPR